jgi:phytoene synthase
MRAPGFDLAPEDFGKLLKKSSFAAGALLLDSRRRRDFEIYYAFCRSVDDCADEYSVPQGRAYLRQWELALRRPAAGRVADGPLLVSELHRVARDHGIPLALFRELIQGALSDLRPKVRFASHKELGLYCHRVAGVVGQACLPLFGLGLGQGKDYAETLGRAFQTINILRDAAEDASKNRIYFALSDLRLHGLTQRDFLAGKGVQGLLADYAARAATSLERADRLALGLPATGLRPSRMMRRLYGALLDSMVRDGLRVFEKRYRLSGLKKMGIILRALL